MPHDQAVWVYAITDELMADLPTVNGVDREPIRSIRTADLAAIVGSVELPRFGEEALRHNLENIEWLGTVAGVHHEVVTRVCREATAIPMQLATMFLDDQRVIDMMNQRGDELLNTLVPLRGRSEWGVKGYAATDPALPDSCRPDSEQQTSGTSYLLRRQAQLRDREQTTQQAYSEAQAVHTVLSEAAILERVHDPQDPKLREGYTMVLNGAYLVDNTTTDRFLDMVAGSKSSCHLELELTGPWPPYSFIGAKELTA